MRELLTVLFFTWFFLHVDIPSAIALGDCSNREVRELRDDGFNMAEIRELCLGEDGTGEDDSYRGGRDSGRDRYRVEPAYTCNCGGGVSCPLNLSGALPRGAPCFCNFGWQGSCRGLAR